MAEFDALLPAILDRAFKGQLAWMADTSVWLSIKSAWTRRTAAPRRTTFWPVCTVQTSMALLPPMV